MLIDTVLCFDQDPWLVYDRGWLRHTLGWPVDVRGILLEARTGLPARHRHAICSRLKGWKGEPQAGLSGPICGTIHRQFSTQNANRKAAFDVRYLYGIINFEHDNGFEMHKLKNGIGMQDKGVIQVFCIHSRCNHLWRIQCVSARWNVSVGCVSDC